MPVLLLLAAALATAAPIPTSMTPEAALQRGHDAYFAGEPNKALDDYARAVKLSSASVQGWLNGAVVLEELGRRKDAVAWYAKAAGLTDDPKAWTALGWAQWRDGQPSQAAATFTRALDRQPDEAYALLGLARLELQQKRPQDALKDLQRAAAAAPLLNIASYYEGQAYEQMSQPRKAVEAYKQAIIGDSYFDEGREALGRLYLRLRDYNGAWTEFSKILDAEPKDRKFKTLLGKIQPLLTRRPSQLRPSGLYLPIPYLAPSAPGPLVPTLRVGIETTPMGKPRKRQSLVFKATTDFDILDPRTGKRILAGKADTAWQLRIKRVKRRLAIALVNEGGKTVVSRKGGFTIKPRSAADGLVALDPGAGPNGGAAGRLLRGRLEATLYRGQLRLVNIVDLENYVNGVVAAEMPVKSPLEALKAQAVVARTMAYFIMKNRRRHRKEGYDLCDEQHCQVYLGARAESARSRDVVSQTRGRVVTYRGKVCHVIYSSNCGGHTQSGKDVAGWGDMPYWKGIYDAPGRLPDPHSPWDLRQWLYSWPQAFCKPSADVYASHFRWTRVMTWADLQDKLDRRLKIGALKAIRTLRRSPSGNVNELYVEGSRRRKKITSEIDIRGLLGVGSLRSTQFVIDMEYDARGKPSAVFFHGGGWGHGVGMCQSGAMGRAEAGETYEQIIKAYFKGVELGRLDY